MPVTPSRIIDPSTGKPFLLRRAAAPRLRPRTRYDAAETNNDSKRHWAAADSLSATAANSPDVRRRLVDRSRYEFCNNGYCQGLILTLANDLVGTGPTLQLLTESDRFNTRVESRWHDWAEACYLAEKLITKKQAKSRDGEGFGLLATNDGLDSPVSLDLRLFECEMCATPGWSSWDQEVDGIEFDKAGNPRVFHILREHPGDRLTSQPMKYDRVPARSVIHWFRRDRPGQSRGVPEITASLPLFAQLRRFTLATLTAAETAADFAVLLKTGASPDSDGLVEGEPFDTMEIERGLMTTLPAGYEADQMKAEHPGTTYTEFKGEILKEIARPMSAPRNVISNDSSEYNYSSARLDNLLYRNALKVERRHCERVVLRRLFRAWLDEAVMVPGLLPPLPAGESWAELPCRWQWPGFDSIDPLKEAKADTERLANLTTTLADLHAEKGDDWQAKLRQRGREVALAGDLGLAPAAGIARAGAAEEEVPVEEPEEGEYA